MMEVSRLWKYLVLAPWSAGNCEFYGAQTLELSSECAECNITIFLINWVISFLIFHCNTHGGPFFFHQTTPGQPPPPPHRSPWASVSDDLIYSRLALLLLRLLPFLLPFLQPPNENKMTTSYEILPGWHRNFSLRGRQRDGLRLTDTVIEHYTVHVPRLNWGCN